MTPLPPDTLNSIGILKRREIEARILAPIVAALCEKFDRTEVLATVRDTIMQIATQQGAQLAHDSGGCDLATFEDTLQYWRQLTSRPMGWRIGQRAFFWVSLSSRLSVSSSFDFSHPKPKRSHI